MIGIRSISTLFLCSVFGLTVAQPIETEATRKPTFSTGGNCAITNARILTAVNGVIANGTILIQNGKITGLGDKVNIPTGIRVIDAKGKVVAPGIVDGHSHRASDATNEGSDSITAEVRIRDVLNGTSKNVWTALASGHTSALILHGSANAIGGESVVIKYRFGKPADELPISDAPRMIKFALGENVTRSQGTTSTRFPRSRMGVEAVYRRAFEEARKYKASWDTWEASDKKGKSPRKDLRLQTLADILDRKVWVQCHSYRADEMLMMARLSAEYGFKIGSLQHGLEAYKIAPELAKLGVGVSIFADNWSFKLEGADGIPFNAALCTKAGVLTSVNTDGLGGTTALNIDAAKAMRYGQLSEQEALQLITLNPAKELGIDHRTGSLEVGKDGDLAIWDGHPLSVYSKCVLTMIEGEVFFERRDLFGLDPVSTTVQQLPKQNTRELPPTPKLADSYALVGADVYPVSGPMIPGGIVVLNGGNIVAVGKNVSIPRGAVRINARGLRVYPGFIDAGNSIGLSEISSISESIDSRENGDYQPDIVANTAIQVQSEHFPVARMGGVLTSLTRPTGGIVSGVSSIVQHFGYTTVQIGLKPKAALTINFPGAPSAPQFDLDQLCCGIADLANLFGGDIPEDILAYVRWHEAHAKVHENDPDSRHENEMGLFLAQQTAQNVARARDLEAYFDRVKKYASNPSPRDLQMEAMVPYVEGQEPVVLRVRNASSIRSAVDFAKRYRLRAILSGAADAWKETALLKEANIPVIINPAGRSTLAANSPVSDWDPYDTPYATPALLKRAGVKFCFASEDNSGSFNLPVRVGQSCAYGLSVEDAIRALTLDAAEILGVGDKLGSIEQGKIGNLVITDGDPFELTTQIRYVFVDGRPAPLESKFTRLRDQYGARQSPAEKRRDVRQ